MWLHDAEPPFCATIIDTLVYYFRSKVRLASASARPAPQNPKSNPSSGDPHVHQSLHRPFLSVVRSSLPTATNASPHPECSEGYVAAVFRPAGATAASAPMSFAGLT